MIPLLLSLAAQGVSLAGSAAANKKKRELVDNRRKDIQNWFDKDYNEDFLNRSENRSALKLLSDRLKEQQQAQANTNAITGASAESEVAQKGINGRTYADFVNNLASKGTAVKQQAKHDYMSQMLGNDAQQQALNQERSNNWFNFGKMGTSLAGTAMQADAMGAFDKPVSTPAPGDPTGMMDAISDPDKYKYNV